jgi:hypothetical protein
MPGLPLRCSLKETVVGVLRVQKDVATADALGGRVSESDPWSAMARRVAAKCGIPNRTYSEFRG